MPKVLISTKRKVPKSFTPSSKLMFALFFPPAISCNQLISTLQLIMLLSYLLLVVLHSTEIQHLHSLYFFTPNSQCFHLTAYYFCTLWTFSLFLFYPNYPWKAALIFWKLWYSQWKDLLNDLVCLPWTCISWLQMPHWNVTHLASLYREGCTLIRHRVGFP